MRKTKQRSIKPQCTCVNDNIERENEIAKEREMMNESNKSLAIARKSYLKIESVTKT